MQKLSAEFCARNTKKDVRAKEFRNIDRAPNSFLGLEIRSRITCLLSLLMWLPPSARFSLDCYKWFTFIKLIMRFNWEKLVVGKIIQCEILNEGLRTKQRASLKIKTFSWKTWLKWQTEPRASVLYASTKEELGKIRSEELITSFFLKGRTSFLFRNGGISHLFIL